jgi:SOS-response transcriptional repressor LexA
MRIRRQRKRLGLTLDELSGRTLISKPYLSLIETGRVPNPPSDDKLRLLEQNLGFGKGDLLTQAHLQRTPHDVRGVLGKLLAKDESGGALVNLEVKPKSLAAGKKSDDPVQLGDVPEILRQWASNAVRELERTSGNAVPVINRMSSDYPKDFTSLPYAQTPADQYLACPDVTDPQAFAARVYGDSMTPRFEAGDIVIFAPSLAVREGDDCFVRFQDGQTTFRRIFFETDNENRTPMVRLQPRNERIRSAIVPRESIAGIHRAVFRYQRVDGE